MLESFQLYLNFMPKIFIHNLPLYMCTFLEHLFRCRFNTSKFVRRQGSGNKVTLVRTRCLPLPYHTSSYWTSNAVWVCFCSPLELQASNLASSRNPLPTPPAEQAFQLTSFHSQHSHDMKIQTAQEW